MESQIESPVVRQIQVNMADLVEAFEDASSEIRAFLDVETGGVLYITREVRDELEAIYAELPEDHADDVSYRAAVVAAVERRNLPAWMHAMILDADMVESGFGDRFLPVPENESHDEYEAMESFIETVANTRLRERLWSAIRGRGAFSRFKNTLASAPAERERWFAFKVDWLRTQVLEWLEDEGISPVEKAD